MFDVPATIPVIFPVVALTVAIEGLLELQVPPATVETKVVIDPAQIVWLPLKIPVLGGAVTVTVRCLMSFVVQPPVPCTV